MKSHTRTSKEKRYIQYELQQQQNRRAKAAAFIIHHQKQDQARNEMMHKQHSFLEENPTKRRCGTGREGRERVRKPREEAIHNLQLERIELKWILLSQGFGLDEQLPITHTGGDVDNTMALHKCLALGAFTTSRSTTDHDTWSMAVQLCSYSTSLPFDIPAASAAAPQSH